MFKRFCVSSGCKNNAETGSYYCSRHKQQYQKDYNDSPYNIFNRKQTQKTYDAKRGNASQRGYSYKWSQYSQAFIKKNPMCVMCGEASQVTDHILPAFAFPELFWSPSNHQALCIRCNKIKSIEDNKKYRKVS